MPPCAVVIAIALCLCASTAQSQPLPAQPISIAAGRVVLTGGVSASIAAEDETYFNYTSYDQNSLRLFRGTLGGALRAGARVSLLGEVRVENDTFRAHAWYVRLRPWSGRAFDVQAGRIPPVFGTFARRSYGSDTPLIGYPLAYQYLTTLRANALPSTTDDLLRVRGGGWRVGYPIGDPQADEGMPVVSGVEWDLGVSARVSTRRLEAAVSITNGALSAPRLSDDNGSKQVAGRLSVTPIVGLVLGVSGSRAGYLADAARPALPVNARGRRYQQRAAAADVEYSRDHWILRGEVIYSAWDLPALVTQGSPGSLSATTGYVEGRYRIHPRIYLAARVDRLAFSRVESASNPALAGEWDANVTRVEGGVGYYLRRNVIAKLVYQHNRRSAPADTHGFVSAQLAYWF